MYSHKIVSKTLLDYDGKILHKPTVYTTWSITKSMSGQNQANIVIQCWSARTGLLALSLSSIDPD
jgi:hypothetical protein